MGVTFPESVINNDVSDTLEDLQPAFRFGYNGPDFESMKAGLENLKLKTEKRTRDEMSFQFNREKALLEKRIAGLSETIEFYSDERKKNRAQMMALVAVVKQIRKELADLTICSDFAHDSEDSVINTEVQPLTTRSVRSKNEGTLMNTGSSIPATSTETSLGKFRDDQVISIKFEAMSSICGRHHDAENCESCQHAKEFNDNELTRLRTIISHYESQEK